MPVKFLYHVLSAKQRTKVPYIKPAGIVSCFLCKVNIPDWYAFRGSCHWKLVDSAMWLVRIKYNEIR